MRSLETLMFCLKLQRCPGIGLKKWQKLREQTWKESSLENIYKKLPQVFSPKLLKEFYSTRLESQCLKEIEESEKSQIKLIDWYDSDYPILLKQSQWAQPILSHYSEKPFQYNQSFLLGIVGSRKSSPRAKTKLSILLDQFSNSNQLAIVSGRAMGIDQIAHQYALENNLNTLAVLGEGIEVFRDKNPRVNFDIFSQFFVSLIH